MDELASIPAAGRDTKTPELPAASVRAELARVLGSQSFINAPSLSRFLAHIVERTVEGKGDELKEYSLGVDVFDRGASFDPKVDTIVRVQARRLRFKLEEYYGAEGREDPVLIELTKGRYVPEFKHREIDRPRGPSLRIFPEIKLLRHRIDEAVAQNSGETEAIGIPVAREPPMANETPSSDVNGTTSKVGWRSRAAYTIGGLIALLIVVTGGLRLFYVSDRLITSPSEYVQITDFTDSATAPSLSPDGRMVAFIRGGDAFLSRGQIWVKLLPNGQTVRLTSDANVKFAPVFSPDDSRVAYSEVTRSEDGRQSWDTWSVPVLGGEPTRLLPNASGLVWFGDRRILFSEFKGKVHLGVVTATEARAEERAIYFPSHERGMAHYSYPSPDLKSILVVEMDRAGMFQQCRLVPFDGGSLGRLVGPEGSCTAAAWSPDGRWMYFGVQVEGHSHLWRQSFPTGAPQQITFGPTEEEGVSLAADGRSLVTSIGRRQSEIWLHDASGDRSLSSEGYAYAPQISADGRRVYYLLRQHPESTVCELRSIDVISGKVERLLPGMSVAQNNALGSNDYDVSRDEREVVFATRQPNGKTHIWLAPLDRSTPPREIASDAEYVSFGAHDDVFFVSLGDRTSVLTRMMKDGTGRERIGDVAPIYNRGGISPDGEWAVVYSPVGGPHSPSGTVALPVRGGTPKRICTGLCWAWWSDDGTLLYIGIFDSSSPRRTLIVPLTQGRLLPDFPASGMEAPANQFAIPGTRVIEQGWAIPGPDPSTYAFVKTELQRNLYRIPLH